MPKKYDTPSEKVKKASGPLPKKLYAPSEIFKKVSGDLDDTEKLLVSTIEKVEK